MKKRALLAVVLPLLLGACSAGSSGGGDRPFSSIGDPIGVELGQVLFTVPDGTGRVDVRIYTLGPNPPGSPVSCGQSRHAADTRLVPLYINGTSADPKSGVADIDIRIMTFAKGDIEPLLLTTEGGKYVPTCDPTPSVHLDGMEAGIQHVIRGVALVKKEARHATVVLTASDGSIQRRRIAV